MSPAERAAWKVMEDTERTPEDREQTAALRRYLTRRILDLDDPTVSFSALANAVDPAVAAHLGSQDDASVAERAEFVTAVFTGRHLAEPLGAAGRKRRE